MKDLIKQRTIEERKLQRNASGYPDPTAYEAIKRIEHENQTNSNANWEYERHRKTIGCILRICELAGYSVEEKIILKDELTGKVWR